MHWPNLSVYNRPKNSKARCIIVCRVSFGEAESFRLYPEASAIIGTLPGFITDRDSRRLPNMFGNNLFHHPFGIGTNRQ